MDRPNTIPWPPIIYGLAIVLGFVLQYVYALPWLPYAMAQFFFMFGLIAVLIGLAIDISAIQTLRSRKTTVLPTKAATHLVTHGPFGFSRNPIYLGNTILTLGLGMAFGNLWLFITGIAAALLTNKLAIIPEEAHLSRKFGSNWAKYSKKVRRWI